VPSENFTKMAEFVWKNNYFESDGDIYCQNSGTDMGTKFAPPFACIFMDMVETDFLSNSVWNRGFGYAI
jgi:hypothetical protein